MQDEDIIILVTPTIYKEDLDQEVELLKLLGKTPNRSIIIKKMLRYEAYLTDFQSPVAWDTTPWSQSSDVSLESIQQITEWALTQSDQITVLIFEFLDGTVELSTVLKTLKASGLVSRIAKEYYYESRVTLTDQMLDRLQSPATIEELYSLARNFLDSKRPEAAVRQILRRFISKGIIEKVDNVYSISQ